jgi:hypothetical protein
MNPNHGAVYVANHRRKNSCISFVKDLFRFYWLPIFIAAVFMSGFIVAWHFFIG